MPFFPAFPSISYTSTHTIKETRRNSIQQLWWQFTWPTISSIKTKRKQKRRQLAARKTRNEKIKEREIDHTYVNTKPPNQYNMVAHKILLSCRSIPHKFQLHYIQTQTTTCQENRPDTTLLTAPRISFLSFSSGWVLQLEQEEARARPRCSTTTRSLAATRSPNGFPCQFSLGLTLLAAAKIVTLLYVFVKSDMTSVVDNETLIRTTTLSLCPRWKTYMYSAQVNT